MKKYYLLLALFSAIIVSCENKEEKAYVNAKNSTSTFVLKNYLMKYSENAPLEHVEEIHQRLEELINDSVDYEFVIGATADISQKYNAETKYLNKHPKGLHFKEVDSMMKADEPAYNEWLIAKKAQEEEEARKALWEEKYGYTRDIMINFKYVDSYVTMAGYRFTDYFVFDIPDENGNGVCAFKSNGLDIWMLYKYEIHDNGDIYLHRGSSHKLVNIYSDCLYVNSDGNETKYNKVLAINEYPKEIEKIKKNMKRGIDRILDDK